MRRFYFLLGCIASSVALFTCKKDKAPLGNGYPEEISKILVNKCATPGCHTSQSKDAAAGLNLETWDDLFKGDRNGAVCIPFSHKYSTLFMFTNTYPDLGVADDANMPFNKPPLSRQEVQTLMNWIDNGAPSATGKIMWADNPNRKKVYVTNQGCDVVTVFDAASQLQMGYIDVGNISGGSPESPHMIKISPDGKHWYVSFTNGTVLQKYRVEDDSYLGQIALPSGSWNTFAFTADSKKCFVVDWSSPGGKVVYADLNSGNTFTYGGSGLFDWVHGSMVNGNYLYVTANKANFLHKVDITDPLNPDFLPEVILDGNPKGTTNLGPHDFAVRPDGAYYFVTCETSNDVRVLDAITDEVVNVIPTGTQPVELAVSKTKPYLFVTCMSDTSGPETNRGSVTIINYNTFQKIANLKINMAEPHGIGVDDANGLVYVANRNDLSKVLPHHSSSCGNKTNGFISFIDLNTLKVIPDKRIEVSVDPYSIAVTP